MSRLDDIKARDEPSFAANRVEQAYSDVVYLLGEVERLTAEAESLNRDGAQWYRKWADKFAEVSVLTAENASLREQIGSIAKARADLDESHERESLADPESVARHSAAFVAFDSAVRAAAGSKNKSTKEINERQ